MKVLWLVAALLVLGAVWWKVRAPRGGADGFEELVASCRGDRAMAERLVDGEAARTPGRGRRDLVARAIDRLASDRRR